MGRAWLRSASASDSPCPLCARGVARRGRARVDDRHHGRRGRAAHALRAARGLLQVQRRALAAAVRRRDLTQGRGDDARAAARACSRGCARRACWSQDGNELASSAALLQAKKGKANFRKFDKCDPPARGRTFCCITVASFRLMVRHWTEWKSDKISHLFVQPLTKVRLTRLMEDSSHVWCRHAAPVRLDWLALGRGRRAARARRHARDAGLVSAQRAVRCAPARPPPPPFAHPNGPAVLRR
jgi:hypothetical protein